MTSTKIKMRLQGHEKFSLREGWLSKGLLLVKDNPKVFQGKEGPDVFGIGNNMVKSLRYWLRAFELISESPSKGAKLTPLGEIIKKYDPYIEDNFTIWALHSQIAKNLYEATSWYMFFNRCDIEDMDKEKVERLLQREIGKYALGQTFSEKSVKSDLDVILSMYGKNRENIDPEDNSSSPFARLGLVKCIDGQYSKVQPDISLVNEWNIMYELAEMLKERNDISIEQAFNSEKGISKIFQIKSVLANELLDRLDSMDLIHVDRTAGLDMIYKKTDLKSEEIMELYYKEQR